ncbi:MAG: threonine-phosphate decarboxylase CobD [Roseiarcus sp.]|jgi:cobalamin biosynthetic protein CobC
MLNEAPFQAALSELAYHGGNLAAARRLFPRAPLPWIDLSTGVNPQPYPLPAITPDLWARLPEPEHLAALEAAAARRYGAPPSQVVAAPGTQALIQLLARLRPRARVGILGFSYGGHERAWRAAGASVETADEIAALAAFDVAIVVNPNNPDGRLATRASLLQLHGEMAARGGALVVDEAFMDLDRRGQSLIPVLPASDAVVLRSFGKTYGLAGLRLGLAIASPDLVAPLRAGLGDWPVSGPAIAIGRRALADDGWLERARERLERDSERLDGLLVARGLEALGGATLFRLARHPRAASLFVELMRRGILARPFAESPDKLRFGIPGDSQSWRRLESALRPI